MLALNIKLTPAQTRVLFKLYAEDWKMDCVIVPNDDNMFFISTIQSLISKKLVDHDNKRIPTYQLTTQGRGLASLVEEHAKDLLSSLDGRVHRAKQVQEKAYELLEERAGFTRSYVAAAYLKEESIAD